MKNIYKITFNNVDYDEYAGFLVIAMDKKEHVGIIRGLKALWNLNKLSISEIWRRKRFQEK